MFGFINSGCRLLQAKYQNKNITRFFLINIMKYCTSHQKIIYNNPQYFNVYYICWLFDNKINFCNKTVSGNSFRLHYINIFDIIKQSKTFQLSVVA